MFRYRKENFSSHLTFTKNCSSLITIFRDDYRGQIVVQLLNTQYSENVAELKRKFNKQIVFQPGLIPSKAQMRTWSSFLENKIKKPPQHTLSELGKLNNMANMRESQTVSIVSKRKWICMILISLIGDHIKLRT